MATEVFDEVGNVLGDTEEGIAGETEEGEAMTSEEAEALEKQGAEAKEEVSSLRKSVNSMKKLNEPEAEESFTDVVIKNVAIAAIFFGVNIFLKKLIAHSNGDEKQKIGDKQKKVTAMAQLMKGITHFAQELVKWTKENEGLMVGVGDGITVPFPDILSKFTTPMHKVRSILN